MGGVQLRGDGLLLRQEVRGEARAVLAQQGGELEEALEQQR